MNVETVQLGDICDLKYGDSLPEAIRKGGSTPVYGSNGVVGWHNAALTHGPTIIIGRKGSIGEVHFSQSPCWPIDTTYYVEQTKRPTDLTWLYYILLALDLTRLNKSAAVPGLNRDDACEKEVALPCLPEQHRIAAIMLKADRLRRLRRYAQQVSETFLQAVFVRMFGDPKTNPNGWDSVTIDDVLESSQYGTSDKSNADHKGHRVLGMGNITYSGDIDLSGLAYVDIPRHEFEKLRLERGDIIFNRTNSTELVGKTAHWKSDLDAVLASYLVKLRLTKNVRPEYFAALLNTSHFKGLFQQRCKKAIGQSNISPTLLREFPALIPPLREQDSFARITEKYGRLNAQQHEAERQAEQLFQTLLQRAFVGEL
jgi:type I restriction enzyme, S subunit